MTNGNNGEHRADRVYVSAFMTTKAIGEQPEEVRLFTLEGVGHGWWETETDAVVVAEADLFLQLHWIDAQRGGYAVEVDIRDTDGERIAAPFHRNVVEIPTSHHVYSWNVPLTGLTIPVGMHYMWVSVEGVPKAPIVLRVFGPDEEQ